MKILELLTPKRLEGNKGEAIAARHIKKEGYKILAKNYVALNHEIDIIAENRDTVIFVEVKTRTVGKENPNEPRPASAVTPEKQRKIISAAKYYIGEARLKKRVRLDIVEVYITKEGKKHKVVHIENAFNSNTAYTRKVKI